MNKKKRWRKKHKNKTNPSITINCSNSEGFAHFILYFHTFIFILSIRYLSCNILRFGKRQCNRNVKMGMMGLSNEPISFNTHVKQRTKMMKCEMKEQWEKTL